MRACVLLEKAVSLKEGHPSFKPSHNYMVAYMGVGVKLAKQPVVTEGEKALEQQMGAQFCCPGASS